MFKKQIQDSGVSKGGRRKLSLKQMIGIFLFASVMGTTAIPVAASAAEVQYFRGATVSGKLISSKQATMTGGSGWATTNQRTFWISNVYRDQSLIAGAQTSSGTKVSFSHARTTGAFSGCHWGVTGQDGSTTVGMTCNYTN